MSKKVTVYSTESCPWCHKAKEWLKEHKIKFSEKNVGENDKAREEMIEKSGQMGVPVITVGDKVIIGFNQGELEEALGIS